MKSGDASWLAIGKHKRRAPAIAISIGNGAFRVVVKWLILHLLTDQFAAIPRPTHFEKRARSGLLRPTP